MPLPKDCNILIVDDQQVIREKLMIDLKAFGIKGKIFDVSNILDAYDLLERLYGSKESISLILSDWEMPGGTGLDFLQIVKSDDRFKKLPFVLITAVNEKAQVVKALTAGANNYLVKPWLCADLFRKLDETWDHVKKG